MAKRVAVTALNASTIDILNVIRANASLEYQNLVPTITTENDIPRVGEVINGYPALANQFISALMNRIALVKIKSAVFNNAYASLKKGYLEYGETVEEAFVQIAKARAFSAEKAEARELKRTLPDVRSAFHVMNWQVQYPVTIQDEDLRTAFLSIDGVQDLIARIVDAVYTAAEYDEFLLFKYLMIKAITKGKMYPIGINVSDDKNSAIAFRSAANKLTFMSDKYNASGVKTATPKSDQAIFMDADYNAKYDVNVLAAAFNMDKADFTARLRLIDDWTSFDNERFDVIRAESDQIDEVTSAELTLMGDVVAVLIDEEWFQVYDNLIKFTEKYVASGMYWNYFLNIRKTVSSSPFSNAIVFVKSTAVPTAPLTLTGTVTSVDTTDNVTVATIEISDPAGLGYGNFEFIQTEDAVEKGIAVHKYGAVIIGANVNTTTTTDVDLEVVTGGTSYYATVNIVDSGKGESAVASDLVVGTTITFAPSAG